MDSIRKEEALGILQNMIRTRTHQPQGEEMDLAKFILSLFKGKKHESIMLEHGQNRGTLMITIPGRDRSRKIALMGHMDSVDIGSMKKWEHAPFSADYEGGFVYGCGAANMKGGLTAMLLSALHLDEEKRIPPKDVCLCFTADGDIKGTGAISLAQGGYLRGVEEIIFTEPTNNDIAFMEKGCIWVKIVAIAKPSFSYLPREKENPIEIIYDLKSELKKMTNGKNHAKTREWRPTISLNSIKSDNESANLYISPEYAEACFDIRTIPGMDNEEILEALRSLSESLGAKNGEVSIGFEVLLNRAPIAMDEKHPLLAALKRHAQATGMRPKLSGIHYFTNAAHIVPMMGIPFAIFGPGANRYTRETDECVSLASVLDYAETYRRYILEER